MEKISRMLVMAACLLTVGVSPVWAEQLDADNTGKNVRDQSDRTLTPTDQSESAADVNLTQRIRQAVVADDSLSTNGKNVKIITVNGVVTLRGPVDSDSERNRVVAIAEQIAGKKNVANQLEINKQ